MDIPEGIKTDFAAGRYRACVEPLEELYFVDRAPLYQGLLKLCVALMQIEMGLSPHRLLRGAADHLRAAADPEAARLADEAANVDEWLASGKHGPRPPVTLDP